MSSMDLSDLLSIISLSNRPMLTRSNFLKTVTMPTYKRDPCDPDTCPSIARYTRSNIDECDPLLYRTNNFKT